MSPRPRHSAPPDRRPRLTDLEAHSPLDPGKAALNQPACVKAALPGSPEPSLESRPRLPRPSSSGRRPQVPRGGSVWACEGRGPLTCRAPRLAGPCREAGPRPERRGPRLHGPVWAGAPSRPAPRDAPRARRVLPPGVGSGHHTTRPTTSVLVEAGPHAWSRRSRPRRWSRPSEQGAGVARIQRRGPRQQIGGPLGGRGVHPGGGGRARDAGNDAVEPPRQLVYGPED